MKKYLIAGLLLLLAAGGCKKGSTKRFELRTAADSAAYVLGMNMAYNLMEMDSTLRVEAAVAAVREVFAGDEASGVDIRMAHRYGNPSMGTCLADFQQRGIEHVIVLPLYPQRAFATTDSVHDELTRQLTRLQYRTSIDFVWDYYQEPLWVEAVADSIRPLLAAEPDTHLLFSFHSVPLKDLRHGDAYKQQVEASVAAIAEVLGLADDSFSLAFQSRFDDAQRWLGPFIHHHAHKLLESSTVPIRVVCPGFAVDCIETLYDIQTALFGKLKHQHPSAEDRLSYLPCLNDSPLHIQALEHIIRAAVPTQ